MLIFTAALIVVGATQLPFIHNQDVLTVHLAAHSHDDVGWLLTIDEYYDQRVRNIYNNVVECLIEGHNQEPRRKFNIVEQAFFSRWYNETSEVNREWIRTFIEEDIIEFVNGGWVMNDEACPDETMIILQMSLGHQYLRSTFSSPKAVPVTAYQIDPFGHSAMTPIIARKLGLTSLVLNRIHYSELKRRKQEASLEFDWQPHQNVSMLSHVLDAHYNSPVGYDFERNGPIGDEDDLEVKATELVRQIHQRSKYYPSAKNFLQLVGDDFQFQDAKAEYVNWDRLISHINKNQVLYGMRMKWSLLREYFDAVKQEKLDYSVYKGDFFPYADNEQSYWTGYFTSKSHLKKQSVQGQALLKLAALQLVKQKRFDLADGLRSLAEAVAEVSHHDGITGTAKEYVSQIYIDDISKGVEQVNTVLQEALGQKLSFDQNGLRPLKSHMPIKILLLNSLETERQVLVQIPVWHANVVVHDHTRNLIKSQVVASLLKSDAPFTLQFLSQLPQFGQSMFNVSLSKQQHIIYSEPVKSSYTIANEFIEVQVNKNRRGLSMQVINMFSGIKTKLDPFLYSYDSYTGPGQSSGAYILRVSDQSAKPLMPRDVQVFVTRSQFVEEITVIYSSRYSQTFRIHKVGDQMQFLEIQNIVGPLEPSTELVLRLNSGSDDCQLYTLDGGSLPVKRSFGTIEQSMSPFISGAELKCKSQYFKLISDRSMAIGQSGQQSFDILIHRRTMKDDGRGVDEPLADTSVVDPTIWLSFEDVPLLQDINLLRNPVVFGYSSKLDMDKQLKANIPFEGVRLLSLELISQKQLLVRVQQTSNDGKYVDSIAEVARKVAKSLSFKFVRVSGANLSGREQDIEKLLFAGDVAAFIVEIE